MKSIVKDVETLSHDRMKGREAGTKHAKAAADYIAKRFKDVGLTHAPKMSSYLQTFKFPKSTDPHTGETTGEQLEGHNVVGFIDNNSKSYVIVGAHFDHLGMGGPGSFHETTVDHGCLEY